MWNTHSHTRRGEGERPWQQRTAPAAPRRGGVEAPRSRPRDATTTTWMGGPRVGRHVRTCSRHYCGSRASAELKADAGGGVDARTIELDGSIDGSAAAARLILIRCSVNVMARPWAPFRSGNGRIDCENDGSYSFGLVWLISHDGKYYSLI